MKKITPIIAIIRIGAIIAAVEIFTMLLIANSPYRFSLFLQAAVNTALLLIISIPFIHIWIIRPLLEEQTNAVNSANEKAFLDPLTKLPNRLILSDYMERYIAGIRRHEIYGAVLLLDLDDFKYINDNFGHDAGDKVLVEVGRRLKSVTRPEDVVSRIGGDEFVVLIGRLDVDKHTARNKVLGIAKKLQNSLLENIDYQNRLLTVHASMGARLLDSEKLDVETVLRDADQAMYKAKNSGKNKAVVFENNLK